MTDELLNNPAILAAVAVAALASIGMLVMAWRVRRLARRVSGQQHELDQLQNEVRALGRGGAGLTDFLGRMEKQQRRLAERQEQLDRRDPAAQSYEHAIKLARRGAGPAQLVEQCGLVRDEAELLVRMYGFNKAVGS